MIGEELDFEVDVCTYINMTQGMSYDEAVKVAVKEVKEAHSYLYEGVSNDHKESNPNQS